MKRIDALALRCALLAAAAMPLAAAPATYKWIDERGVVNYGNVPPPAGRDVRRLDESASRVSTIESVPPAQRAREDEFLLRARIARLEAELEAERLRRAVTPAPVPVYAPYLVPAPVVAAPFAAYGVPFHWSRATWVHRPVHPPPRGGVTIRVGKRR
jgi:hypothetical protein